MKHFYNSCQIALSCLLVTAALSLTSLAQSDQLADITKAHEYTQRRVSSYDKTGANADAIKLAAGATTTILDAAGPGIITHIWFTIASPEDQHLKKLVLRMYWDGETEPSVEAPIGGLFRPGPWRIFSLPVCSAFSSP